MSSESLIGAVWVFLFTALMIIAGFYIGRHTARVDASRGSLPELIAAYDSLQLLADSLAAAADGHQAEALFWRIQSEITNDLLAANAAAIDSFNRLTLQRHAQRAFIAGAAVTELDSFFAARYPSR
jgi:hypothetical protein